MSGAVAIEEFLAPNRRFIAAREASGLSREQLMLAANVGLSTIGQIERVGYKPGYGIMRKLARALGKKVSEIFPGEED